MASCYAAVVSLQTTIHSIQNHPNPPISLPHDQAQALLLNSASLQNFLEHHSHREDFPTDELKNKIIDAVYAAEDLIEKSTVRGSSVRHVLQRAAECGIPFDADTDEFWMKRIMEDNKHGISAAIEDMDAIIKEITEASCYAALLFLQTTIHSILNHPNPPISLDHNQSQALLRNSASLQDFLEYRHSHREDYPTDEIKKKIIGAASAAEDLIKKSAVLRRVAEWIPIDADIDEFWMKKIMEDYKQGIYVAIRDMDAIIKEIPEDKEKPGDLQLVGSISSLSHASPSHAKKSATVEFDVLNILWNMLTRKPKSSRQIILITGMGGIGKTTLATQAYQRDSQVKHFDVRVFVSISQNFREQEFLQDIICQLFKNGKEVFYKMVNEQMLLKMYQHLKGRRYLIILDDVWSIDEKLSQMIRTYFPDDANGSRIIVTTRVSSAGVQLSNSSGIQMKLLNDDQSWELFVQTVFKGEVCPFELEEIGKTIAINCRGLPLSIVVVGGFLAKSEKTKQYWAYVARDLSSIVNSENNQLSGEYTDKCLNILFMSYEYLPIHLKPCFLYMGIWANDARIRVSWLVELLVAEGFLKPISNKSMEIVAREYIDELADRNLISIDESGPIVKISGKRKYCTMHDVVRDLCKREAGREKFLYFVVGNEQDDNTESGKWKSREGDISGERRIVVERKKMATNFLDTAKKEFLKTGKGEFLTTANEELLKMAKEKFSDISKGLNPLGEGILNTGKGEDVLNAYNEEFLNTVKGEEFLNTIEEEFLKEYLKKYLKLGAVEDLIREAGEELEEKEFLNMLEKRQKLVKECLYMLYNVDYHNRVKLNACLYFLANNIDRKKMLEMLQSSSDQCASDAKHMLQSASNARSLVSHFKKGSFSPPSKSCLLRVIKLVDESSWTWMVTEVGSTIEGDFGKDIIRTFFNSRYVAVGIGHKDYSSALIVPSSISLLWNLETLILNVSDKLVYAPIEIWKMPHLMHLKISMVVSLPDPLDDDELVLVKLQTLWQVLHFKCKEQWIKKIPNIRKLRVFMHREDVEHSCLSDLRRLDKMESLRLRILDSPVVKQNITFPLSLRKLTFGSSNYDWQEVTTMIGALPNLEKLSLRGIKGTEWILTQGQFSHLKRLHIMESYELKYYELKYWIADDHTPFPQLEFLYLESLRDLEEIPSSIGDAPNLQKIDMVYCSDTSVVSAKQIVEGQEAYGDSELLVRVIPLRMNEELKRLESPNFQLLRGEYTDELD